MLDERRNLTPSRIDEGLVALLHLSTLELDGAHLDDGVGVGLQPGGFQVDADELAFKYVTAGQ